MTITLLSESANIASVISALKKEKKVRSKKLQTS